LIAKIDLGDEQKDAFGHRRFGGSSNFLEEIFLAFGEFVAETQQAPGFPGLA
jgi:hypothetical protein